jgi:hypothetical protein
MLCTCCSIPVFCNISEDVLFNVYFSLLVMESLNSQSVFILAVNGLCKLSCKLMDSICMGCVS